MFWSIVALPVIAAFAALALFVAPFRVKLHGICVITAVAGSFVFLMYLMFFTLVRGFAPYAPATDIENLSLPFIAYVIYGWMVYGIRQLKAMRVATEVLRFSTQDDDILNRHENL